MANIKRPRPQILNFRYKVKMVENSNYLTYPKTDCMQTWNLCSMLSMLDLKCKIINQKFVINGSDIINLIYNSWIVQNGKYLTYPKIDCEQT